MNPTPKEQANCPAPTTISVFVGIDWADAKHDICLLLPDEEDGRHVQIENTPEALHDWVLKLIAQFAARGNIYVATEKARGALVLRTLAAQLRALLPFLAQYKTKFFYPPLTSILTLNSSAACPGLARRWPHGC